MDLDEIRELIALAEASGLRELEIAEGTGKAKTRIRIVRATAEQSPPQVDAAPQSLAPRASGNIVAAPLSGTFYQAPAPGERPFVAVGDEVAEGSTLCIIESMKMMNKIAADRAGTVAEVLVRNGQPVETGAALFRLV